LSPLTGDGARRDPRRLITAASVPTAEEAGGGYQ